MNWFTKKKVFYITIGTSLIQIVSRYSVNLGICNNYASRCTDFSSLIVIYSFIFLSAFIFSLLTYKLNERIFVSWRNFSLFFISISFIVITFIPTNSIGFDIFPVTKGSVILFLTIAYSIISLLLILYKSFKKD